MMKVLISGAGIAGLSLALRLHQRGLTPFVVERSPGLRDGGYMLGLSDPGLDAAERMGVADALWAARTCRSASSTSMPGGGRGSPSTVPQSKGWSATGSSTSCAVTSSGYCMIASATRSMFGSA